jgi:cysteinyl-tRNA synthetase
MSGYGALSGRKLEDMLAGARVEVADYKRHAGDFVLWKPSADSEPGWESPWGRGRPGWHLECSAMIKAHLGDSIDIHGGGRDLIFPHHENERAQSCCAYGGDFVRHWVHNAYVDMDGEKMSKSLGNTRTVRELLNHYPGEVLRCALISAQYRSALNFSEALLDQARSALDSWYGALRRHSDDVEISVPMTETGVYAALLDDLNTPEAFAVMHAAAATLNKATDPQEIQRARSELVSGGYLLGLLSFEPNAWFQQSLGAETLTPEAIEARIEARVMAKANKDYQLADDIRASLEAEGVVLEDGPDGTTWRRSV